MASAWIDLLKRYLIQQSEAKAREGLKTIDDATNIMGQRIKPSPYGPPIPDQPLPQEIAMNNMIGQGVMNSVNPGGSKIKGLLSKYGSETSASLEAKLNSLEDIIKRNDSPVLQEEFQHIQDVLKARESVPFSENRLPLDEASRMGRAKEMGFDPDTTWYHGTRKDIKEFDPNSRSVNDILSGPKGMTFFSKDPNVASGFSGVNKQAIEDSKNFSSNFFPEDSQINKSNVIPTHLRVKKTFDYENPEHVKLVNDILTSKQPDFPNKYAQSLQNGDWEALEDPAIRDTIKNAGFDSMYVKEQGSKNIGVFDPSRIRSKFAEFDPDKMFSKDITAGIGAVTGAGLLDSSSQEPEEKFSTLKSKLGKY